MEDGIEATWGSTAHGQADKVCLHIRQNQSYRTNNYFESFSSFLNAAGKNSKMRSAVTDV